MKTLFINLVVFVCGIIALEIFLGDWWLDNRLFLTRIPRGVQIEFAGHEFYSGFTGSEYTRDKYGFRGQYSSIEEIDVLTVGGSTTDQRFIDDSATWQAHARAYIESETGKQITVVNAGVDGQSTYGHIENFNHWFSFIPKLKPKYLLFYVGLNDKWEGIVPVSGDYVSPVIASLTAEESEYWRNILKKSVFYNAWINAVGYAKRSEGLGHRKIDWDEQEWHRLPMSLTAAENSWPFIDAYKKRLAKVITLARTIGAKPIVVNQRSMHLKYRGPDSLAVVPKGWTIEQSARVALLERDYANATIQTCEAMGAICVDLFNDLKYQFSEEHFYDFDHNTPAGTELIGNYLGKKLGLVLSW